MKNKRILALFLSLVFLLGSFPHILAVDALQTEKNDMEDIHAIAQHAPTFFVSTKDWTNTNVIKTTPLYDLEDRVVAYPKRMASPSWKETSVYDFFACVVRSQMRWMPSLRAMKSSQLAYSFT